jgi:hypothetical protein
MRRAVVTFCTVLFVQVGQTQQIQPLPTALGGIVLQAESGEPLPNAQVTLTKMMTTVSGLPAGSIRPPVFAPVTTDATGRFNFDHLEPGSYRISAARNGFVRENYGARFSGAPGTIVNLNAGQTLKDFVWRRPPPWADGLSMAQANLQWHLAWNS